MGRRKRFDGTLSIRVTASLHDDMIREAFRRDIDVSDVARERLGASPSASTRYPLRADENAVENQENSVEPIGTL